MSQPPAPLGAVAGLARYRKFITAVAGQALTYAALYYGTNKWVALGVAIAAALGVYAVPNAGHAP